MRRAIVIIHPGALGDVLLAVQAVNRLRRRFPRHCFILVANGSVGQLLQDCRLIDVWSSVAEASCAELFGGSVPASGVLRSWLEQCDLAVAWVGDEDGTLASTLRCYRR